MDLDLTKFLLELILVKRKDRSIFVYISYEKLPDLCSNCGSIGHNVLSCRRIDEMQRSGVETFRGKPAVQQMKEINCENKTSVEDSAHGINKSRHEHQH